MEKIIKYHATNYAINPSKKGKLLKTSDVIERLDYILDDDDEIVFDRLYQFKNELVKEADHESR